ncbi:putative signal transduction histidine kinase [Cellulomonas flavigena DSM 20109]|uniref:Putative signal transduction histidine kinase n=1 Tax=Cellulomonas flavigena (strain ATCC 482 / DSM 20109 / BCRC 11376 / JCM 18109 / NBRC 3775 / NCIMB 8073 / NRS 134) TaxID=446466 RepID=D5UFL1_CELFN|nr:ATP-binding protein [Cellulomonas flavigena]ADG72970.1 putative signal transduction histidine kinase [Cellulomonas flavigena DSM 20109]
MTRRSYRESVDACLRWAYALGVAITAGCWAVIGLSASGTLGPGLAAATVAYVLVAGVGAVRAARHRLSDRYLAVLCLAAVAWQVAWALEPSPEFTPGARVMGTAAVVLCGFLFARTRARVTAIATALVTQVVVDSMHGWDVGLLLPAVAAGVVVALCAPQMRAAADRADAAAAERSRAQAAQAEREAAEQARREAERVVHDHVVSALRAVTVPGLDRAEVRAAAAVAVSAIERSFAEDDVRPPCDVAEVLAPVADAAKASFTSTGAASPVPAEVADIVVAAVQEALRNVERHTRVTADVSVRTDPGGVAVEVRDDGPGFDPTEAMSRSDGLRGSVVQRMRDVGGSAEVDSAPGHATVVRLAWRAPVLEPPRPMQRHERIAAVMIDVRRPLTYACVPYLAMYAVFAAQGVAQGAHPWWLTAWFVGLAAVTAAVLLRAHTGLSRAGSTAALTYVVVGTLAAIDVLPGSSLRDYSSWALGAGAPLLAVVAIVRPRVESVVTLVIVQAALLTAAFTGRFGPGPWQEQLATVVTPALSMVLPVGLGLAIARGILTLGTVVTDAHDAYRDLAVADAARRAARAVRDRRFADLRDQVVPFLRDVATGTTPAATEDAAASARVLEAAARDELRAPGLLDASTRELLRQVRAAGCQVRIQPAVASAGDLDAVRGLLVAALSHGTLPTELVLSAQPAGEEVAVHVVARPDDADRAAALGGERGVEVMADAPGTTWARLVVPALAVRAVV